MSFDIQQLLRPAAPPSREMELPRPRDAGFAQAFSDRGAAWYFKNPLPTDDVLTIVGVAHPGTNWLPAGLSALDIQFHTVVEPIGKPLRLLEHPLQRFLRIPEQGTFSLEVPLCQRRGRPLPGIDLRERRPQVLGKPRG